MISHKPLKSVSHNFGHSFISLMNYINDDYFMGHLLKQARKTNCSKLTVDILKNLAEPTELLTVPIKTRWRGFLIRDFLKFNLFCINLLRTNKQKLK